MSQQQQQRRGPQGARAEGSTTAQPQQQQPLRAGRPTPEEYPEYRHMIREQQKADRMARGPLGTRSEQLGFILMLTAAVSLAIGASYVAPHYMREWFGIEMDLRRSGTTRRPKAGDGTAAAYGDDGIASSEVEEGVRSQAAEENEANDRQAKGASIFADAAALTDATGMPKEANHGLGRDDGNVEWCGSTRYVTYAGGAEGGGSHERGTPRASDSPTITNAFWRLEASMVIPQGEGYYSEGVGGCGEKWTSHDAGLTTSASLTAKAFCLRCSTNSSSGASAAAGGSSTVADRRCSRAVVDADLSMDTWDALGEPRNLLQRAYDDGKQAMMVANGGGDNGSNTNATDNEHHQLLLTTAAPRTITAPAVMRRLAAIMEAMTAITDGFNDRRRAKVLKSLAGAKVPMHSRMGHDRMDLSQGDERLVEVQQGIATPTRRTERGARFASIPMAIADSIDVMFAEEREAKRLLVIERAKAAAERRKEKQREAAAERLRKAAMMGSNATDDDLKASKEVAAKKAAKEAAETPQQRQARLDYEREVRIRIGDEEVDFSSPNPADDGDSGNITASEEVEDTFNEPADNATEVTSAADGSRVVEAFARTNKSATNTNNTSTNATRGSSATAKIARLLAPLSEDYYNRAVKYPITMMGGIGRGGGYTTNGNTKKALAPSDMRFLWRIVKKVHEHVSEYMYCDRTAPMASNVDETPRKAAEAGVGVGYSGPMCASAADRAAAHKKGLAQLFYAAPSFYGIINGSNHNTNSTVGADVDTTPDDVDAYWKLHVDGNRNGGHAVTALLFLDARDAADGHTPSVSGPSFSNDTTIRATSDGSFTSNATTILLTDEALKALAADATQYATDRTDDGGSSATRAAAALRTVASSPKRAASSVVGGGSIEFVGSNPRMTAADGGNSLVSELSVFPRPGRLVMFTAGSENAMYRTRVRCAEGGNTTTNTTLSCEQRTLTIAFTCDAALGVPIGRSYNTSQLYKVLETALIHDPSASHETNRMASDASHREKIRAAEERSGGGKGTARGEEVDADVYLDDEDDGDNDDTSAAEGDLLPNHHRQQREERRMRGRSGHGRTDDHYDANTYGYEGAMHDEIRLGDDGDAEDKRAYFDVYAEDRMADGRRTTKQRDDEGVDGDGEEGLKKSSRPF